MFELSVLNGFKTVGSFILYQDTFAFIIGPDNLGKKLGIMRLGGHIEENESLLQALEREIKRKLQLHNSLDEIALKEEI